ncbi:MAG: DMT family transporter [Treponema sp.]|jgi:drug/metabolite transporter (DMT)-like permease|nr:DMT family transporter [Treponema sp.]
MTERHKALGAMVACVLFWGFSFISIKVAVAVFPPMTLGCLRFAVAALFLRIMKNRAGVVEALRLRDIPYLAGAGFTGVTLYFFCENNGVALVSASEASIITAVIPVLTMAAEWLRARLPGIRRGAEPERLGVPRWIGALISAAGVWLVAGASLSLSKNLPGYYYMAGAALSWVAYCFLTKPLFSRCSRLHITFWQSAAGLAGFLPFAILEYPRWERPGLPVMAHLLFLGVCCSALGYWFYARALDVLGVSASAVFINFIPAVTAAAGFVFLGERLSPAQWGGAALAFIGVYLAVREPRQAGGPGVRRPP